MTSQPTRSPERLDGLLFFPVTAYGPDGALDLDVFRAHVRRGVDAGARPRSSPAAAPGEFHALTPEEFQRLRRGGRRGGGAAGCPSSPARATAPRSPSGTRSSPRRRAPTGCWPCRRTSSSPTQEGLLRHYTELAAATSLDVIVYQRDNAVFTPETVVELARTTASSASRTATATST